MSKHLSIFTGKVAVFALVFVLINTYIDQAYKQFLEEEKRIFKQEREFFKEAKGIDSIRYLFLGDSHLNDLQTERIPGALMFNSNGESILQTHYKLKHLIEKQGIRPRCVVLPADLHSLSGFRADRIHHEYYWSRYVDFKEVFMLKRDINVLGTWIVGSLCSYFGEFKTVVKFTERDSRIAKATKRNRLDSNIVKARFEFHLGKDTCSHPHMMYYYDKTIKLCKQNNINIILVKYPVTKPYHDLATQKFDTDVYYEFFENLEQQPEVQLLDYQRLFFGTESTHMLDADHVNLAGGTELAERLKKDLAEK